MRGDSGFHHKTQEQRPSPVKQWVSYGKIYLIGTSGILWSVYYANETHNYGLATSNLGFSQLYAQLTDRSFAEDYCAGSIDEIRRWMMGLTVVKEGPPPELLTEGRP